MSKKKTIEEIYDDSQKSIEELIKQLQMAGVKDKTIKTMLKDIKEYQEKLYIKAMENTFIRMRKKILNSIVSEDLLDKGE